MVGGNDASLSLVICWEKIGHDHLEDLCNISARDLYINLFA